MHSKSGVIDRLEGVVIIVNTFLPLVLVLAVSLAGWLTWQNLSASLLEYRQSLQQIVTNAQKIRDKLQATALDIAESADQIKKKGEDIGKNIDTVVKGFNKTVDGFGDVFANAVRTLDLKPHIPVINVTITIPIGSVLATPLRSVGKQIARPFKPLSNSFASLGHSVSDIRTEIGKITDKVNQLKYMQAYLDVVIREYRRVIRQITMILEVFGSLFKWIAMAIAALALWFSFGYIIWIRRRLKRGLALLYSPAVTTI